MHNFDLRWPRFFFFFFLFLLPRTRKSDFSYRFVWNTRFTVGNNISMVTAVRVRANDTPTSRRRNRRKKNEKVKEEGWKKAVGRSGRRVKEIAGEISFRFAAAESIGSFVVRRTTTYCLSAKFQFLQLGFIGRIWTTAFGVERFVERRWSDNWLLTEISFFSFFGRVCYWWAYLNEYSFQNFVLVKFIVEDIENRCFLFCVF